jgi:hypothetical protein
MVRQNQLKFRTAIITYPSDYDGWLTLSIIMDNFENKFFPKNTTIKIVGAKEHADEEIQRDHHHLYLDSPTQLTLNQKYFDIPLPEPVVVFIKPDTTRTYKFFSDIASQYGIESLHDPTMAEKIDKYITNEIQQPGTVYEILSVAHPNIQLKKQYGDKYFMLKYVVKSCLIARSNFDVDEELKYLQDNCEKLCEKANQLIESNILKELNVKTVPELIDLLKKYRQKLRNKRKRVRSKYKNSSDEECENKLKEMTDMIRHYILNEPNVTKTEVLQKIYEDDLFFYFYSKNYLNYNRLINDLFKNRPNAKPKKNYDFIFWVPTKLYDYLMWLDKWVEYWYTGQKDKLEHRPKGLILIGGTRTGKTSLMSTLGDFSYFKNVWNVDNWEGLPPYTIMDDMDAQDEGKGLSFSWFKPWFGAQDAMTVTDKYKPKYDILNGKPLIWINNYDITESFQSETAQQYIKGNMVYVNIGKRSLYEEPDRHSIGGFAGFRKFDPKTTWYYKNIVLKEAEKKQAYIDNNNHLFINENCQFCNKLINECECNKENIDPNSNSSSTNSKRRNSSSSITSSTSTTTSDSDLEPLNIRKRKLSIEAESREHFEQDKGRLLETIELKIHASQEQLNKYEMELNQIKTENNRLNQEYNNSFKIIYKPEDHKYMLDYRQTIMNEITQNNYELNRIGYHFNVQKDIYKFLYNCYYYIDKSMY